MEDTYLFKALKQNIKEGTFRGMIEYVVTKYLYTNNLHEKALANYGHYIQYYFSEEKIIKLVLDVERVIIKAYVKYYHTSVYEVFDWQKGIVFSEIGNFFDQDWMDDLLQNHSNLLGNINWREPKLSFLLEMGNYQQVEHTVSDDSFVAATRVPLFDLKLSRDFILSKGKVYHRYGEVLKHTFRRILSLNRFEEKVTKSTLKDWATLIKLDKHLNFLCLGQVINKWEYVKKYYQSLATNDQQSEKQQK